MLAFTVVVCALGLFVGCSSEEPGVNGGDDAGPVDVAVDTNGGELDVRDADEPDADADEEDADAEPAFDADPDADVDDPPPTQCPPEQYDGEPLDGPSMQWEFIPVAESRCMNDTTTGIGVSLNPDSDNVMIFMQGGGACFDYFTCQNVWNADGFGPSEFADFAGDRGTRGIFDRSLDGNPVADWNFVFIPYCTGDVHAGSNPDGPQGRVHVGYENVHHYLKRIVPTFSDASRVLLTGSSAGGFGTMWNLEQTIQAFEPCGATVYGLNDAGPPMGDDYLDPCLQQIWRDAWNLDETLPTDCQDCFGDDGGGLVNLAPYLADNYDERVGLLSTMEDITIREFFGYGYSTPCEIPGEMPAQEFHDGISEYTHDIMGPYDHHNSFLMPGDLHTVLQRDVSDFDPAVVAALVDWITMMIEDDPNWDDTGP